LDGADGVAEELPEWVCASAPASLAMAEKAKVLSGSEPPPAARPSPFVEERARGRAKEAVKRESWRDDPNWMWGGTPKPTPAPEPSPALIAHLAHARQAELRAAAREESARRGGGAQPGAVRPMGLDPGYNPPWLRRERPQYAVGGRECSLDG